MLSCNRAPCGSVSRHEHARKIIAREALRAAGLNCVFEIPMLIPNSDKRLVICLHTWRRHPLRTLCRAIPRWTSRFDLHALLLVGGMRLRSLEDRLNC
jgi:hypothetical protein